MFTLCNINLHYWEPEEEFSTKKFKRTLNTGTVQKCVRITTKQICNRCGKIKFNNVETQVGYSAWKEGEEI